MNYSVLLILASIVLSPTHKLPQQRENNQGFFFTTFMEAKQKQAEWTQPTAHLYAHTAACSNHHLACLCLHIHTRSPHATQDRIPRVNPKILKATSLPLFVCFFGVKRTVSPRQVILPQREEETGKLQLNCSPAGRVACCRGRGRPGSKHGIQQQPVQRERGCCQ